MITTLDATTVHTTPNAVMRRYPATTVALWRTEMAPRASGPPHAVDHEQAVVVLHGVLEVAVDGVAQMASAGDAVTIPADAQRQLTNRGDTPLVTLTAALPGLVARVAGGDPVEVPWAT
jgi:quercetin dioxygenase-like cupin family protein